MDGWRSHEQGALSLEGVEVKGWMRGGWARGPSAKTRALRASLVHGLLSGTLFIPAYLATIFFDKINYFAPDLYKMFAGLQSVFNGDYIFKRENNELFRTDSRIARYSN